MFAQGLFEMHDEKKNEEIEKRMILIKCLLPSHNISNEVIYNRMELIV